MPITSEQLRSKFLHFFKQNGHTIEKSAPLIPQDDPTLLFVNAGMVQFKNVFTQKESKNYDKATTSQKCVRAGGKHNDLENVGQTARHHTFFEMLGNFSFGAYFKEQAITLAWRFLTEELKIDSSKLSVSVFAGDNQVPKDSEAERIWHEKIGLPKSKIKHLPRKDNFWQMGDTGPCGPCSEIHYDRSDIDIGFGGNDIDDQVVEIWNLVFMEYEMMPDKSLRPLPKPCVDTGMGLERLTCIVNQLPSNYDTDLLKPLINKIQTISNKAYHGSNSRDDIAMRVIADHARSCSFLIADGLLPGNEGRSYVLRRFMRRAIRHGAILGLDKTFFHLVCQEVVHMMSEVYPELKDAKELIIKVTQQEENTFRKTLNRGLLLFDEQVTKLNKQNKLSGRTVFKLYETYGFPSDLTHDLAKEKGIEIDWQEFKAAQKEHEQKSAGKLGLSSTNEVYLKLKERLTKTLFLDQKSLTDMKVLAILKDDIEVSELSTDECGVVIFDRTPFYGESGGQIGDTGSLISPSLKASVTDTKKVAGLHLHITRVSTGSIRIGQTLEGHVNWARRQSIKRNHSATHLLHSALRQTLGNHVIQRGSLVAEDKLRFDFSHFEPLNKEQLIKVENLVNQWILDNEEAKAQTMFIEQAKELGALALFGEKYDKEVRVLNMGSHSIELCGGTHCHRTGDIGLFRIVNESALAQGIRRIEAVTGMTALKQAQSNDSIIKNLNQKLGVKSDQITTKIDLMVEQIKKADKEKKLESKNLLKEKANIATKNTVKIGDIEYISQKIDFIDNVSDLRNYSDLVKARIKSGVIALGLMQENNKCTLILTTTKDLKESIHAGKLIAIAAPIIGGKGGGRADFAQAGGTCSHKLDEAFNFIKENLQSIHN